jgi:hypothetical protein
MRVSNAPVIKRFDENSAREFVLKSFAAWESLNADNLATFFRKAPQDRSFHLSSTDYHDWNDYKTRAQLFMDQYESLKIKVTDARVFREGGVVYAAFCYDTEEVFKDGKRTSREGRYTGVLLPSGESWQIAHEQWSVPVRAAGWENY